MYPSRSLPVSRGKAPRTPLTSLTGGSIKQRTTKSPSSHKDGAARSPVGVNSPARQEKRTVSRFLQADEELMRQKIVLVGRCRPFFDHDLRGGLSVVQRDPKTLVLTEPILGTHPYYHHNQEVAFDFDLSYVDLENTVAEQERIVDGVGALVLDTAWQGYNISVCAYGGAETGKTYTLFGSKERPGLVPRVAEELLHRISTNTALDTTYELTFSMMEIYMERVRDLLSTTTEDSERFGLTNTIAHNAQKAHLVSMSTLGLKVREHPKNGPYVEGLSVVPVKSVAEVKKLLAEGEHALRMDDQNVWQNHIRGHVIVQLGLTMKQSRRVGVHESDETRWCKVMFADLAEREVPVPSSTYHVKEATHKNRSLQHLDNCLRAASKLHRPGEGAKQHFPYRGSPLTMLMKDSFVGFGKVVVLSTVSPSELDFDRTIHTLQFSQRLMQNRGPGATAPIAGRTLTVNKKRLHEMVEELEGLIVAEKRKIQYLNECVHDLRTNHTQEVEQLKRELEQETSRTNGLAAMEEENRQLRNRIEEVMNQLKTTRASLEEARRCNSTLDDEKRLLGDEIADLKARLSSLPALSTESSVSSHHRLSIRSHNSAAELPRPNRPLYKARRGDAVDKLVAFWVNSSPHDVPDNFARSGEDLYDFGLKKITVKIFDEKLMVRVGGGYQEFEVYLQKYGSIEAHKFRRSPQGQAWFAVHGHATLSSELSSTQSTVTTTHSTFEQRHDSNDAPNGHVQHFTTSSHTFESTGGPLLAM
eukprot:gnl/Hemi2/8498_TR2940_c0_g1_i1.p1 gnl/Hemi2/8498_TR2940_c0_g1~~gnl/Hemi2/8498_TR2940_c0_g1_i1.p1  ORF type:complete len:757 (+),score=225.90 gnl/Hemi2/8498_TR2940_c0_g1_i1:107-2377(+)